MYIIIKSLNKKNKNKKSTINIQQHININIIRNIIMT